MKQRLRFFARGTAQVADVHAQEHPTHPVRRCIGRRWQEVLRGRWTWVPTENPQETDFHHDLVRAAKDGDLWPADEATAKACGLAFDPDFGGEETETIRQWRARTNVAQTPLSPKKDAKPTDIITADAKGVGKEKI